MQTLTDAELMEAYSSRQDEDAFGELMRRHGALVYRACHRLLKDAHEAEDASQAVFVVLARKAGGLGKGDLAAWLYRVAHLVAAETVRKRMHRAKREESYAVDEAIQTDGFAASDVADPVPLGLVDAALLSLPERCREAVILRYLQNHSEAEAARRAGCAVGTLSARASRGIAKLRQRLAKRGVALSGVALVGLLTSEASAALPETLLPSILATVKIAAATGAAATGATSTAAMLAKGAMKAMFIAKVKMVAAVVAAVVVTGTAVPVSIAVAQAKKATEQPATQTQAAPIPELTATSSNIVIRIVAADVSDRLVSDLEVIKPVAAYNGSTDAPTAQSAPALGDDVTLWVRGARVDGTHTFETYYKGVFTGRKSELTFARGVLQEGEHVIDPGRHVFRIDKDGNLSSTDPDIVIEGPTVNLKAYRIEIMCVDGNKSGPPETRLLGRALNVDELRPGFNPAAVKFDASNAVNSLSHYRSFCPLRLYLPANTNELAYALRPGDQRFRVLPGGTVELQGQPIPTIKAEGSRIVVSFGEGESKAGT